MKHIVLGIILCASFVTSKAQTILTLNEAITQALENNDELQIGALSSRIANAQVYKSNVGMSPRIDWNANMGGSVNNVNQAFFDGREINRVGRTFNPNTNVTLNWTFFDGGRMMARYKTLQGQKRIVDLQNQSLSDVIVAQVKAQYLAIARQKALIEFLIKNIKTYNDRYEIASQRWELGRIAKPDVLQSQNDVIIQQNLIEQAKAILIDLKTNLNIILKKEAETDFDIETVNDQLLEFKVDQLIAKMTDTDENLRLFDQQLILLEYAQTDIAAGQKPRFGLSTGIGYSLSNTNAGLITLNQNAGLNALVTASWNLFDGGHTRKQKEINKLQATLVMRQKQAYVSRVKGDLTILVNRYNLLRRLATGLESNEKLAAENLMIIQEKFKLGASTILEVNDAQQRYDTAAQSMLFNKFDTIDAALAIQAVVD
jgi:outer membrane protein